MVRHGIYYSIFLIFIIILLLYCSTEPIIRFPGYKDPDIFTDVNYSFSGSIKGLRDIASSLGNGKSTDIKGGKGVEGIVINDYMLGSDEKPVYGDGFFIQDKDSAIYVKGKDGVSVKRGDRIHLSVTRLRRSSCKLCKDSPGLLTINKYKFEGILTRNNKLYFKKVNPSIFSNKLEGGYGLVRIIGTVVKKSDATWAMSNNSWGIYILSAKTRERSDIYENSKIVVYGVIASYNKKLVSGLVKNQNAIWVHNARNDIVKLYVNMRLINLFF